LIVDEFDVLPADILLIVFLLFQLENVPNEELLQVLVGVVDAKLFETFWFGNVRFGNYKLIYLQSISYLLMLKFSKPKMSSTPIELVSISSDLRMAQFNLVTIQMNSRP
jgi:hypothetical protein